MEFKNEFINYHFYILKKKKHLNFFIRKIQKIDRLAVFSETIEF